MLRAFVKAYIRKSSFIYSLKVTFRPTPLWGPKDPVLSQEYKEFLEKKRAKMEILFQEEEEEEEEIGARKFFKKIKRFFIKVGLYIKDLYWDD